MKTATIWNQSIGEEVANSVSHGVGLLAAAIGTPVLLFTAWERGSLPFAIGAAVFAATMLLLYLGSTLYHAWPRSAFKSALQIIDHSAIFLLIAGTYTPFTLVSLRGRGPWGFWLFGAVWGMALAGILFKAFATGRLRRLSVVFYLAMGWCVLVALQPLMAALAPQGMRLLFLGGIAYTAGVVFYAWQRLPYHHAVWHLFVLAGSVLHFLAVLLYVIPPRG